MTGKCMNDVSFQPRGKGFAKRRQKTEISLPLKGLSDFSIVWWLCPHTEKTYIYMQTSYKSEFASDYPFNRMLFDQEHLEFPSARKLWLGSRSLVLC